LNVGAAVVAGLVPAIHAAARQISRLLGLLSVQRLIVRLQGSWMTGSSPAMTEKQNTISTHTYRFKSQKFYCLNQKCQL
jgi:hypothetical protein